MTTHTKEKTLARERQERTGENYTSALAAIRREHSAGDKESQVPKPKQPWPPEKGPRPTPATFPKPTAPGPAERVIRPSIPPVKK